MHLFQALKLPNMVLWVAERVTLYLLHCLQLDSRAVVLTLVRGAEH